MYQSSVHCRVRWERPWLEQTSQWAPRCYTWVDWEVTADRWVCDGIWDNDATDCRNRARQRDLYTPPDLRQHRTAIQAGRQIGPRAAKFVPLVPIELQKYWLFAIFTWGQGYAKCFFSQCSKPNELIFNTMFYNSACLEGPQSTWIVDPGPSFRKLTRSQAVARIADRTAKNCRSHLT